MEESVPKQNTIILMRNHLPHRLWSPSVTLDHTIRDRLNRLVLAAAPALLFARSLSFRLRRWLGASARMTGSATRVARCAIFSRPLESPKVATETLPRAVFPTPKV